MKNTTTAKSDTSQNAMHSEFKWALLGLRRFAVLAGHPFGDVPKPVAWRIASEAISNNWKLAQIVEVLDDKAPAIAGNELVVDGDGIHAAIDIRGFHRVWYENDESIAMWDWKDEKWTVRGAIRPHHLQQVIRGVASIDGPSAASAIRASRTIQLPTPEPLEDIEEETTDMQSITDINALYDALLRARSIALATHVMPDGDSIGTVLAWRLALQQLNPQAEIVALTPDPIPNKFLDLPGVEYLRHEMEDTALTTPDVVLVLDMPTYSRLGMYETLFTGAKTRILIDHHARSNDAFELVYCETGRSSTAELSYGLLDKLGIRITPAIAMCLLTGIVTDTGGLRLPNVSAKTLQVLSKLVQTSPISIADACDRYIDTRDFATARLHGEALAAVQVSEDKTIAWTVLTPALWAKTGAKPDAFAGIPALVRTIEGTRLSLVVSQHQEGAPVQVSLRSRGDLDVGAVARELGGGGHKNAAGATLHGITAEEAAAQVLAKLQRML